jgi:lysylphosphatidylglycerol synthetase-like protein (DUF2156 family)
MVGIQRRFSSFAYNVQKAYRRILAFKISWTVIALIGVAASIFILGGGVFDIIEKPLALLPGASSGSFLFYYPYELNAQTLNESVFVMFLYVIGFAGLATIYQSTKYAHKPREAFTWLLIGIILTVIAFYGIETLIALKLSG